MGVDFVYVHGSTLTVKPPSYPILTSGPLTYPSNKPVCAVHLNKSGGSLMVFGSASMFNDDYFESEENHKIMDFALKFLLTDEVEFEFSKDDNENP